MERKLVIQQALSEVGYDPGDGIVKYFVDLFPNQSVSMFPGWCVSFIEWIFMKAYGIEQAKKMLCAPSGFSPSLADFYEDFRNAGRYTQSRKIARSGDLIFFRWGGRASHVGLIIGTTDDTITFVDGNHSHIRGSSSKVAKSTYKYDNVRVSGYGIIDYEEVVNYA